ADRRGQLGEVAIERAQVAALHQHLVAVAKYDGAKPVPLGLVEPALPLGDRVGELGQHRFDRRPDRQLPDAPPPRARPPPRPAPRVRAACTEATSDSPQPRRAAISGGGAPERMRAPMPSAWSARMARSPHTGYPMAA